MEVKYIYSDAMSFRSRLGFFMLVLPRQFRIAASLVLILRMIGGGDDDGAQETGTCKDITAFSCFFHSMFYFALATSDSHCTPRFILAYR